MLKSAQNSSPIDFARQAYLDKFNLMVKRHPIASNSGVLRHGFIGLQANRLKAFGYIWTGYSRSGLDRGLRSHESS